MPITEILARNAELYGEEVALVEIMGSSEKLFFAEQSVFWIFWNFLGGCKKSFYRKMAPTATFFRYIPSKKKIQATLIYFLEASQAMKKDDFW